MIDLEFAELHAGLFIAGTNLEKKLDPNKRPGLKLAYDENKHHLYVTWKDKTMMVPSSNIVGIVEGKIEPKNENQHKPQTIPKFSAQVESPIGHVFSGPGAGKTGRR